MTTTIPYTEQSDFPVLPITIALGELPSGVRRKPNTYWNPSDPRQTSDQRRTVTDLLLTTETPEKEIEDFNKLEVWQRAQIRAGVRSGALHLLKGELVNTDTLVTKKTPDDDERRKLVPETEENMIQILEVTSAKKLQVLFKRMMMDVQIDRLKMFLALEEKGKKRRTVLSYLRKAVKMLGEHTPIDTPDPTPDEGAGE